MNANRKIFGRIAAALILSLTCGTSTRADLTPVGTFQGNVGLSIDGVGGNSTPVGDIMAEIPVGSAVLQAYLYVAGTPFPWYANSPTTIADYNGAGITLEGNAVTNFSAIVGAISDRPDIGRWYTGRADVTNIVQSLVAADPLTSSHSWTYSEGGVLNNRIDGGVLAIIFEHASLPEATVVLLDGGQRTGGETTDFSYGDPLGDPNEPGFFMHMSLGISFSCCGQVSSVNVNGQQLSSSAGDNDDGGAFDGGLITVGGIGDSLANPTNPLSVDPLADDELYNLQPFVSEGDTLLRIRTSNVTNDDNIFLMALHTSAPVSFVPEPTSVALIGIGLPAAILLGVRRRRTV